MSAAAPEPTRRDERIAMLDITRGIAVLGILLMNITGLGLPHAYDDPTNWGGYEGANLTVWRVMALFFEGTMRGLFTLLFGASALLFLERHTQRWPDLRPADLYFRRTLWLIVFGFVNGYLLLWDGDVLYFYGVTGLLLFVFRNMPARRLIIIATVVMCLQTLVTVIEWRGYQDMAAEAHAAQEKRSRGAILTDEESEAIEALRTTNEDFKPTLQSLEETVEKVRASYASALADISKRTWYVETEFFFRHGLLECVGMMLLGMALFKLGVLTGESATRTYLMLLVVGYAVGLPINVFEMASLENAQFAIDALIRSYLTYDLGRIPMTLGHVGLIGLLCRVFASTAAARTMAAVGQMALTNYLAQSLICMLLFTGAGFALYGQLERYQLYYVVIAIWVLQLAWSPLWLRHFRFGPAEWLWRSLTYWRKQPLRRALADSSQVPASI